MFGAWMGKSRKKMNRGDAETRRRKIESAIRKPRSSPGRNVLGVGPHRPEVKILLFFVFSALSASPRFISFSSEIFVPRIHWHREALPPDLPGAFGNPRKNHSAHKTRKRQKNKEKKPTKADCRSRYSLILRVRLKE